MTRAIKDVTCFYYDSRDQFRRGLQDVIEADNCGRRLKTLKGLSYEFICKR